VLDGLELEVAPGELVVITGGRGAGKTVLLEILAGVRRPGSGQVTYDGIPPARPGSEDGPRRWAEATGYVADRDALAPELTAEANVSLPLLLAGWKGAEAGAEARGILERFGVVHTANVRAAELSAGERRLVGVARALVGDPLLVWADEPTLGLGRQDRALVIGALSDRSERGATVVAVSGDPDLHRVAGRVLSLALGRLDAR
jgi:ABC-type lipoprotein export system ATPase subunit